MLIFFCLLLLSIVHISVIEIVGTKYRVILASIQMCTNAIFTMLMVPIAYFIRDAFYLQLALFTPALLYIVWYM